MRTLDSFNDVLDFYPTRAFRPALARFGGALRIYWNAMRDGLAAARAYHELTSRGVPHQTAVTRVFTKHFAGR